MGYSFRSAASVLLHASSHRQDSTHHGVCYTSRGELAGTRNSRMGQTLPPHGLLFPISSKCSFICIVPLTGSTHHGVCYTSRGELAGTRNSRMGQTLLPHGLLFPISSKCSFTCIVPQTGHTTAFATPVVEVLQTESD